MLTPLNKGGNGRVPLARRVVITGLGIVACCGIGKDAFWRSVRDGISGIKRIQSFDVSDLPSKIGGEVQDFDPTDFIEDRKARRQGRFTHFCVASARMALDDAALDVSSMNPYEIGAAFGSSGAGCGNIADEGYRDVFEKGPKHVYSGLINEIPAHATSAHVSIEFGLKGPTVSNSTGCVTSIVSVHLGAEAIRRGEAKCMVVGAAEACLSEFVFSVLCRQRVLSTRNDEPEKACKPFDLNRDGLVLGEGGAALVLESAEHALNRGARIYAEVLGVGFASEAYHMVMSIPTGKELAKAIREALIASRLSPRDIDYVCAHGIGNKQYDVADTRGYKIALGDHAYNVPVSSIKAVTAQPFAAAGAFQAIAVCMALAEGIVPPTINYETPDPDCDLDYVPNRARHARIHTAILNSHSFGGTHGAMVLRRFEDGG
ncbi:MAG: beta-ketoacyl-[acyl-carrier-protein] synthase family protein [Armatimonadetes bacterium]|nr:beta-ketoacyl-[acyl-carrier-protein] synthase family protein [Armatimonadota bacterium]